MKNLMLTAAAATFTAALSAPSAKADYLEDNLVRQSHRVESYASSLRSEFRIHFRHTAEYGHLMSDAYSIARKADAIHGMVHHIHCEADLYRLETELRSLDRLVHHLGDLVEEASHGHGGGHAHGDTRHVQGLVSQMNRSIHSMESSVEAMEARFHRPICPAPPVHVHPGHPDHGHGHVDPRARLVEGVIRGIVRAVDKH